MLAMEIVSEYQHVLVNCNIVNLLVYIVVASPIIASTHSTSVHKITEVIRHHNGDNLVFEGSAAGCKCPEGYSSPSITSQYDSGRCQCFCHSDTPVFRDDTLSCVSDIKECLLAEFLGPEGHESIPHVYLPVKGQLINPKAEVALMGLKSPAGELVSPVCVVTKAQKLTPTGWQNLPNTTRFEPPFRLHRSEGKTFLRWVGDVQTRWDVEGHLVLVTLRCRDAANHKSPHFNPCVAFRAAGRIDRSKDVTGRDVQDAVSEGSSDGSTLKGWLIGGAVMASAVIVYLSTVACVLYRRRKTSHALSKELGLESGNVGGVALRSSQRKGVSSLQLRSSLITEAEVNCREEVEDLSGLHSSTRRKRAPKDSSSASGSDESTVQVNPSSHGYTNYSFTLDSEVIKESNVKQIDALGEENDEEIDDPYENTDQGNGDEGNKQNDGGLSGSAAGIIHAQPYYLHAHGVGCSSSNASDEVLAQLPSEEYYQEQALQQGLSATARRKLYFNPSYFEPEMLQEPPPAALDFLDKIREIISSAKLKMRKSTFQPSLNDIPEDDYNTYYSQSRPQSRITAPLGTPGRRSKLSFRSSPSDTEDIEDLTSKPVKFEYENVVSLDPQKGIQDDILTLDSLDGESEAESRASTLRRIAKRVNEKGTSFVSEIIRTLDKKNKSDFSLSAIHKDIHPEGSRPRVQQLVKVHTYSSNTNRQSGTKLNAAGLSGIENHPDIIKPSVLRKALKDNRQKSDYGSSFENFCQEMIATFNRIKRYGESKTPASTINNKKKKKLDGLRKDETNNFEPQNENRDGKVRKWLEGITKDGMYKEEATERTMSKVRDNRTENEQHTEPSRQMEDLRSENKPQNKVKRKKSLKRRESLNERSDQKYKNRLLKASEKQLKKYNDDSDNIYEEITAASLQKHKQDARAAEEDSSCSDLESVASDTPTVKEIKLPSENVGSVTIPQNVSFFTNHLQHETEDLDSSFEPDTLERPQKKRIPPMVKPALHDINSDYCTTDSENIYASGTSVHSVITNKAENRRTNLPERNKPPLPPKQSISPDRNSCSPPVRPPKSNNKSSRVFPINEDRPPLPQKIEKSQTARDIHRNPPSLPVKKYRKHGKGNIIGDSDVPELSDEAAEAILHGLQATTVEVVQKKESFRNRTKSLGNIQRKDSVNTRRSFKRISNELSANLPLVTVHNISISEPNEERIRGQFILAPEGKSPTSLSNSLSKSGRGSSSTSSCSDRISNASSNVKLCHCAKSELEKHFIEKHKPNADTVKKTWQKVMEKSDPSLNETNCIGSDKLTKCKKCTKQKQDDSGYQSSDSNKSSIPYESSCSLDMDSSDDVSQKAPRVSSSKNREDDDDIYDGLTDSQGSSSRQSTVSSSNYRDSNISKALNRINSKRIHR